jgi:hypothetical protein
MHLQVFAPLTTVQPMRVSSHTEAAWQAAVAEYGRRIKPIELRVAHKLKEMLGVCRPVASLLPPLPVCPMCSSCAAMR